MKEKKGSEEDKEDSGERNFIIATILIPVFVIGLWLLFFFLLKDQADTTRGTFGDMFGSVNAIFSGLAFGGIIITILLQRNELKLQRSELRQTRKEFQTQNETLKTQRFENTFFNLLNLHHSIVNAIDFRYYKNKPRTEPSLLRGKVITKGPRETEVIVINGRDVFRHKYVELRRDIAKNPQSFESIYLDHYGAMQLDFGHYFRNLYRMIKLVDQSDFAFGNGICTDEEQFKIKYQYTSIIRAQLSDFELSWLFYNCLCKYGKPKFKPLIERYSLFKNLPGDLLPFDNSLNELSLTKSK